MYIYQTEFIVSQQDVSRRYRNEVKLQTVETVHSFVHTLWEWNWKTWGYLQFWVYIFTDIFFVILYTSLHCYLFIANSLPISHSTQPKTIPATVHIIIIKSFYSLWSIGHRWRASRHCSLQLSPWPRSMIFLCFLSHPLLSFATFSSACISFYIPEDSTLMQLSLLLLFLYVMCVQSNSIFFFLSYFLLRVHIVKRYSYRLGLR